MGLWGKVMEILEIFCEMVMTSAQLAAALALAARCFPAVLARLLIFVLAAVMEALLAARLAAFLISLLESLAQVEMALAAASSNLRHFWKAVVQFFRAVVMALVSLLALQFFTLAAVWFRLELDQQLQASVLVVFFPPMVFERQMVADSLKLFTSALQLLMKVKFG